MAQVVPLIGKAFAAVGGLGGVTGAGAATAGAGIVSSIAGGVLNYQQGRYQAAVAMRMAAEEEKNAALVREAGGAEAKQQDEEAVAQISDEIARQGASGFSLSSGSFIRRRSRLDTLASRDRTRIVEDANRQGESANNRAASYRAEAKASRKSLFSTLLDVGLGINKSLISGANLNAETVSNRINNNARAI